MKEHSRLQIYSMEEASESRGICIARCVGGVVRVGQTFTPGGAPGTASVDLSVTVTRIERYGRAVGFFDQGHAARVHLSGSSVSALARGTIIVRTATSKSAAVS